ncbi:GAF domain-containing protein [Actinomadura madurae]|uniref:GAF domain-containing protein n=1 Tax=Actinomadura madurae TaxID=1993 RepID=UPI0035590A1D
MGITSLISAPLLVRGELLGVMSLALSNLSKRPDPHYDGFDRDLIGAIASRVALAVDNALLFEEERDTALAFQKHLLPGDRPPPLDGLQIAWRYEPPARWSRTGTASRPRSAATGTTSSRCRRAASASSSATSRAAGPAPPP